MTHENYIIKSNNYIRACGHVIEILVTDMGGNFRIAVSIGSGYKSQASKWATLDWVGRSEPDVGKILKLCKTLNHKSYDEVKEAQLEQLINTRIIKERLLEK